MTILVLEENPVDEALIRHALAGTEHTVLEAKDLDHGLEQMTARPIDVVIVSLSAIPELGLPSFQRLLSQSPGTKLVALAPASGTDGLTTLLLAESLHAHHLLAKPVDTEQLLAIIQLTCPLSAG
jgi:DNA-binding response OmpR family regulator